MVTCCPRDGGHRHQAMQCAASRRVWRQKNSKSRGTRRRTVERDGPKVVDTDHIRTSMPRLVSQEIKSREAPCHTSARFNAELFVFSGKQRWLCDLNPCLLLVLTKMSVSFSRKCQRQGRTLPQIMSPLRPRPKALKLKTRNLCGRPTSNLQTLNNPEQHQTLNPPFT